MALRVAVSMPQPTHNSQSAQGFADNRLHILSSSRMVSRVVVAPGRLAHALSDRRGSQPSINHVGRRCAPCPCARLAVRDSAARFLHTARPRGSPKCTTRDQLSSSNAMTSFSIACASSTCPGYPPENPPASSSLSPPDQHRLCAHAYHSLEPEFLESRRCRTVQSHFRRTGSE
jgi:hypothetical protein